MAHADSIRAIALLSLAFAFPAVARASGPPGAPLPIVGRWDVTVAQPDGSRQPSWLEIREDAHGLAVRMVGRYGSPFDVPFVAWDGRHLEFQLADGTRWRGDFNGRWLEGTVDPRVPDLAFRGTPSVFRFEGTPPAARPTISAEDLRRIPVEGLAQVRHLEPARWTAVRAPELPARDVHWGKPQALFDGRTLAGWRPRHERSRSGWTVRDGALTNANPADDLVSLASYKDFKLHLQFRLQDGSDSGVHLRGRYEVQLTNREDPAPDAGSTGSIYGMIAPEVAPRARPGEWNTLDVTLVGRTVSVSLNGDLLIDRRSIPGITGDALDADEGRPGPIVLQGYIGPVEYRDIVVTPAP